MYSKYKAWLSPCYHLWKTYIWIFLASKGLILKLFSEVWLNIHIPYPLLSNNLE